MGSKVKSDGNSVVPRKLAQCTEKGREAEEVRKKIIDDLTNELHPTQENLSYYKRKMSDSIKKFEEIHNRIERHQEDCKQYLAMEQRFCSQTDELAYLKELRRTTSILLLRVQAESAEMRTKNYVLMEKLKHKKKLNYDLIENVNEEGAVSSDQIIFISQLKPVEIKPHVGATLSGKVGRKVTGMMNAKASWTMKEERENISKVSEEYNKLLTSLYKETCIRYADYVHRLIDICEEAEIEKITQQKNIGNIKTFLEARMRVIEHLIIRVTDELQKVNEEFHHNEALWQTERERLIITVNNLCAYVTGGKALSEDWAIYGGGSSTQRTFCEDIAEEHRELEKKVKAYKDKYENLMEENDWSKCEAETCQILLEKKLEKLKSEITMQMKNYKELDRRQRLEVDGFLSEIKLLQNLMKNLERKITRGHGKDSCVITSEVSEAAVTTADHVKKIGKGINDLLCNLSVMQSDLC